MTRLRATTPTLLLAAGCLLLGSTGGAVAAKLITGADVKNGSLTGADLKAGSVPGNKLKADSVGGGRIHNDSLTGKDLLESSLGTVPSAASAASAGSAGSATFAKQAGGVEDGKVTTDALADLSVTGDKLAGINRRSKSTLVPPNNSVATSISCLGDTIALRGGSYWDNVDTQDAATYQGLHLVSSGATATNGWQVRGYNGSTDIDAMLVTYVDCLD